MMLGVVVELRVGRQRLLAERVEDRAAQRAVAHRADERALVDQRAARDVDEPRARLRVREHLASLNRSVRVRRQRQRQDDEVALRHELRQAIGRQHLDRCRSTRLRPMHPPRACGGWRSPGCRTSRASSATRRPIEPRPTTPTVTSLISRPSSGCHVLSRCSSSSCGSRRLTARIIISTYSAIGSLNTPRALVIARPRSSAAGRQHAFDAGRRRMDPLQLRAARPGAGRRRRPAAGRAAAPRRRRGRRRRGPRARRSPAGCPGRRRAMRARSCSR